MLRADAEFSPVWRKLLYILHTFHFQVTTLDSVKSLHYLETNSGINQKVGKFVTQVSET